MSPFAYESSGKFVLTITNTFRRGLQARGPEPLTGLRLDDARDLGEPMRSSPRFCDSPLLLVNTLF